MQYVTVGQTLGGKKVINLKMLGSREIHMSLMGSFRGQIVLREHGKNLEELLA
jgi:hypothetical protein